MNGLQPTVTTWRPQAGPQKALIDAPFGEILFGGARGGGKTDGVLGKFGLKEARFGSGFNGVFFRREMPQADDLIERAKEIYLPTGAEWREQSKTFLMPHGGRLRFRPLESIADAAKYQGQNLSDAAVEEAGNYPSSAPIDMLFGALRSKGGVPIQLILTANPGGPGHQWIKARFIAPAPEGLTPITRLMPTGKQSHRFIYIPSRVADNKILLANDPGYVDRLALTGSPELVKAWLYGDWNVIAGAFFPEFDLGRHLIAPRELPEHWFRFRSLDWGSARPFSVGWWAVSDGELPDIPRGALVRYREWYGSTGKPNEGLRMTAEEVAAGIAQREAGDPKPENGLHGVADPAIFSSDGGPSIGERMARSAKVFFRPADNARVSRQGALGGWDQVRARLRGDETGPGLLIFSTCRDLIRTLPALQHDPDRPEDVDSDGEDHAPDELRYACMSRPWVRQKPVQKPGNIVSVGAANTATFNDLWKTAPRASRW
jgi:hypothetical protein